MKQYKVNEKQLFQDEYWHQPLKISWRYNGHRLKFKNSAIPGLAFEKPQLEVR